MKPSSTNRQLLGLSGIRGEPTASPELRLGWMQATIRLLSERKGKNFFLTSPLIGLIEKMSTDGYQKHSKAVESTGRKSFSTLLSTLDFPAPTSAVPRQQSALNS